MKLPKLCLALLLGFALSTPCLHANDFDKEAELRIQNFKVEDDFEVELFADQEQVINPSAICFDDKGRMFVGEIHRWRAGVEDIRHHIPMLIDDLSIKTSADRLAMYQKHSDTGYIPFEHWTEFSDAIRVVSDTDGDGRADESHVWADDFDDPLDGPGIGLLYGDGKLYYTNIPHLWMLQDTDGDDKADERESIQEGFGVRMSISGHDMHGLVWGPDGRIYWSLGDRGYTIETEEGKTFSEPTEGAVFRCEPDGSNVEVYYYGLRNPQELAFDKYGNLFTCDNDADAKDTGRLVYILEGGDSGWDAGHQALLNFHPHLGIRTPFYPKSRYALNMWLDERIWETRNNDQPHWTLPPVELVSWGPSGLTYNYGATAFPDRYADYFFVCNFGGAKGDLEAFTVKPDGAGFVIGEHTKEWMVGLGNTDADFGPDGKLYISSFNNNGWVKQDIGNVYTMFDPAKATLPVVKETQALLSGELGSKSDEELAKLLSHPDLRVRMQSQFKLAKQGLDALDHFVKATQQKENQLARLHGIWGLGQVARYAPGEDVEKAIMPLLEDTDDEVRAQAAKTLADLRYEPAGSVFADLVASDSSNRVRCFAAIGIGRCGYQDGVESLAAAAEENNNEDLFLRHGLVMGLHYLDNPQAEQSLAKSKDAAVRMVSLLAMRRSQSAEIAQFLADEDSEISGEAVRAINDLEISEAMPALAAAIETLDFPSESSADWLLHTRLINANWRDGDAKSGRRLLEYAAKTELPEGLRNDALLAVASWQEPGIVDPVVAHVRPLPQDNRGDIAGAVKEVLPDILSTQEPKLLITAMKVAKTYEVDVPTEVLLTKLSDPKTDEGVRINALEELWSRNAPGLKTMLPELITDADPEIRGNAVRAMLGMDRDQGLLAALALLESETNRDRQLAIEALAEVSEAPQAMEALSKSMDQAIAGDFPKGALLELLTAAESIPDLAPKLEAYRAALPADNSIAQYRESLWGGSVDRGETIFATHAAGQCSKCHKVGTTGGVAGPDLSDIGKRHDPDYILASIVAPTEYIVPGYGLTIVFLEDGSSVGGSLMEETDEFVRVKVGEDEIQKIAKSDIKNMNPPISAMPPMGILLNKAELRDLVAYLNSLKKKSGGGH